MSDATRLLHDIAAGDHSATTKLLPLLYGELHRLARQSMHGHATGHTLQPTALIHEAYLRMFDEQPAAWEGKRHFLCFAAKAMRSVLIDHARAQHTEKRGQGRRPLTLEDNVAAHDDPETILALHDALTRLGEIDPDLAQVVELRFFGGLGVEEAAEVMGTSPSTVKRSWRTAKAWLRRALDPGDPT